MSPSERSGRSVRGFLALFGSELTLTFRRARTWVLLGVLAAVPMLIGIAIKIDSRGGGGGGDGGPGFFGQITQNGVFLALASLIACMPFFLPTAVCVAAGESIAGETSLGTLRGIITAPAGRSRLLAAKMVALAVFCQVSTFVVWLSGLVVGLILFPVGPVTLLSGNAVSLGNGLARALVCAVLVGLSMLGLAAIGLFVSSMISTPLAAMAAAFGGFVIIGILSTIPQLDWLHPWTLMNHWTSFADVLRDPPYWTEIGKNLLVQAGYVAVAYSAAWARFTSRDIN